MKKFPAIVLVLLMLAACCTTAMASTVIDVTETLYPELYTTMGYKVPNEPVTLKISPDGVLTISGDGDIGNSSAGIVWSARSRITKVIVEEGVRGIPSQMFGTTGFDALTSISFPSTLDEIPHAFCSECKNLTDVVIANGVEKIGDFAFYGCESLTRVTIPASVTVIDVAAFNACKNLRSVSFAEGLKRIEQAAFSDCTSLENISLPKSLKQVGYAAFQGDTRLVKVYISEGTTTIS